MSGQVFTIVFHGTNEHPDKGEENEEICHWLTAMLRGLPSFNYLVCNGPGAVPPTKPAVQTNRHGTISDWCWWMDPTRMLARTTSFPSNAPVPGAGDWSSEFLPLKDTPLSGAAPYAATDTKIRDWNESSRTYKNGKVAALEELAKATRKPVPIATKGLLAGEGMDDLIRHAICTVWERFPNGKVTINMVGWSRGAFACIRAANWFQKYGGTKEKFEINIFAFDPVPGGDAREYLEDGKTLTPLVKRYVSILSLHDGRSTFQPVDLSHLTWKDDTTVVAMLPMPGQHSTATYFAEHRGTALQACADIGRYLAWKFLKDSGSPMKDGANDEEGPFLSQFDATVLCESYASMMIHLPEYARLAWSTWLYQHAMNEHIALVKRDVLTHRAKYLARGGNAYFLNEHHVAAFLAAWPKLANHLGVKQVAPSAFSFVIDTIMARRPMDIAEATMLRVELKQMSEKAPDAYKWVWVCAAGGSQTGTPPLPADWSPAPNSLAIEIPVRTRAQLDRIKTRQERTNKLLSGLMERPRMGAVYRSRRKRSASAASLASRDSLGKRGKPGA